MSFQKHRNALTEFRNIVISNPDTKMIVTNVWGRLYILLLDPAMIKDFLHDQERYHKADFFIFVDIFLLHGMVYKNGLQWKN